MTAPAASPRPCNLSIFPLMISQCSESFMKKFLPFFLLFFLLAGCGGDKTFTDTIFAMDTVMSLTVYDTAGENADLALSESRRVIYDLEDALSVTDPDSGVSRLNRGDPGGASGEVCALLAEALGYAALTRGAFDPTLYALTDLWGFYDDDFSVPSQAELDAARSNTGYENIIVTTDTPTLPEGMGVDLGGIAKGYAAQKVLETMGETGVEAAVISLGGNVGLLGTKPDGSDWTVAVEKPDGSGETMGLLSVSGGEPTFVVTSGAYQRYFEENGVRYHHILSRETGCPAETDLLSVTIISDNGPLADALSTALFVMGLERAVEFWETCGEDFDMVLFDGESLHVTPGVVLETEENVNTLPLGR